MNEPPEDQTMMAKSDSSFKRFSFSHSQQTANAAVANGVADSYAEARAHLLDELRWLNRHLAAHALRLRRDNFYESLKDFRGFFIAHDEVDDLLAEEVFGTSAPVENQDQAETSVLFLAQAQQLRCQITERMEKSAAQNLFLPLRHLRECFRLRELELQVLLICMAPQLDGRYEKLYAYLQNDLSKKTPSVDLILSLLCSTTAERMQALSAFHLAAPLRHYRLLEKIENSTGTSAAQHFLRADARIVQYVLGHEQIDERLLPHLRFVPPLEWRQVIAPEKLKSRLQKLLQNILDESAQPPGIIYLHGRPGVGKKTIARALCHEAGLKLAVADLRALLHAPENFAENIRLILREGRLQRCAVYFDHLHMLETVEREFLPLFSSLAEEVQNLGWITLFGSEKPLSTEYFKALPVYAVEIPAPDFTERKALWQLHLNGTFSKNEFDPEQLANRFDLTGGQIAGAVRHAQREAFSRELVADKITLADLLEGSRLQGQPKLSMLARKIAPKFQWPDLVLPPDQMAQLHELVQQVKYRDTVMGEWGFANKLSLGHGLNALFAGPSGTGKTMAAEVIANELGIDLYKIDLSAIVSKYIGETEKNLNRLFVEAEHSNAILFFDEADALFGRRSEVRDAHDRYANIEIAYLLQKMEEFEGITILATNLLQNLDEAFKRRLRFIIEFPFPNEEYRRLIWQGIWPKDAPLAPEVDLNFMAKQFKLTGGNVRNIALAASFLAAENGKVVTMSHLLQATRREFQKMGQLVSENEFRVASPTAPHKVRT